MNSLFHYSAYSRICKIVVGIFFLWGLSVQGALAQTKTDHVIIVLFDGLRADAVSATSTPVLYRLSQEGSASFSAKTVFPPKTLPAVVSLISGTNPSTHGIRTNNTLDLLSFRGETLFSQLIDHNLSIGAVVGKRGVGVLASFLIHESLRFPKRTSYWSLDRVVQETNAFLLRHPANFLYIHFNEPDLAGHKYGWMTKKYFTAVKKADLAVGRVIENTSKTLGEKSYTLIITADHGGHGRQHGVQNPQDMMIPWIVWGRGVKPNAIPIHPVSILDIAPTTLWLLGIPIPSSLQGRAVSEVFE